MVNETAEARGFEWPEGGDRESRVSLTRHTFENVEARYAHFSSGPAQRVPRRQFNTTPRRASDATRIATRYDVPRDVRDANARVPAAVDPPPRAWTRFRVHRVARRFVGTPARAWAATRTATHTATRAVPSDASFETEAAKAMFDLHAEAEEGTAASSLGAAAASSGDALESVAEPSPPPGKYVPSPIDASAFTGQIVAFVFIALAVGYVQVVLNPTAKARFNASDEDKRAYVKELFASENEPGDKRGLERWYYRRVILASGLRPRGDQTKGGTVFPGLAEEKRRGTREREGGGE